VIDWKVTEYMHLFSPTLQLTCLILFVKINIQKSEIWMTKQVNPGAVLLKSIDAEFGF